MRKKIFLLFTLIMVLGLLGVQVFVSHQLSTLGFRLKEMEREIDHLKLENELLEKEIATSSSLMTIRKKAEELGFKIAPFLYLEKPPVALKNQ